jgi:hypothetical protein
MQLPQRKLKREEGEEGASCRTIGIETQGQKPNASPTRTTGLLTKTIRQDEEGRQLIPQCYEEGL